jgi:hypothetical protein
MLSLLLTLYLFYIYKETRFWKDSGGPKYGLFSLSIEGCYVPRWDGTSSKILGQRVNNQRLIASRCRIFLFATILQLHVGNFNPVTLIRVFSYLYNIHGSYNTVTIIDFLDIVHHAIFFLNNLETELCVHPEVEGVPNWAQSIELVRISGH